MSTRCFSGPDDPIGTCDDGVMRTQFGIGRIEAFSDGVFAIAVTLLVLDVRVDGLSGSLTHRLAHAWPQYASYGLSFLVIGTMWVNHHMLCSHIESLDRPGIFANLGLLAVISFLPFPTHLLGQNATSSGADATAAAFLYSMTGLLIAGLFFLFTLLAQRNIAGHRKHGTHRTFERFQRRGLVAPAGFVRAGGLSFVEPRLCLPLFIALAIWFAVTGPSLTTTRPPAALSSAEAGADG